MPDIRPVNGSNLDQPSQGSADVAVTNGTANGADHSAILSSKDAFLPDNNEGLPEGIGPVTAAGDAALTAGLQTAIILDPHEEPRGAWATLTHGVATVAGWAFYQGLGVTGTALKTVGLKGPAKIVSKVQGGFLFPLTSDVYTSSERYALAWQYMPAKLQAATTFYGLYRSLKDNTFPIPDVNQGPQPVPSELQLNDPITSEETIRLMDDFLSGQTGEGPLALGPLALEVGARFQEAYGFNESLRDRAVDFAKAHRAFLLEDARRATELYRSDVPVDASAKEAAYVRALEAYHAVRWDGEPVGAEVFAALRDIHDAGIWMDLPQVSQGDRLYMDVTDLRYAESGLASLTRELRREKRVPEANDEYRLYAARKYVRTAMDNLAEMIGLGTSSETFTDLSLPATGLGLRPQALAYAVSRHPSFSDAGDKIIVAHQELHKAQDALRQLEQKRKIELAQAKKEGEKSIEAVKQNYDAILKGANERFQESQVVYEDRMRNFLDTPRYARLLQGELVSYHAAREVLLHNPDLMDLLIPPFSNGSNMPDSLTNYYRVLHRYQKKVFEPVTEGTDRQQLKIEALQAEEAMNRVREALLDSSLGNELIHKALQLLEGRRTEMTGFTEAIIANADYWHAERQWSRLEVDRKETRLPEEIAYLAWRDQQIGEQVVAEVTLMFDAAERMMRMFWEDAVLGRDAINKYNQAMGKRDAVLERLNLENERRAEHWTRVADPTLVLDMEKTGEDVPLGHSISWNRAMEAAHAQAAKAYNAAARACSAATGQPRPRLVSLTATALHDKLTPHLNPAVHAERAKNLITRFSGEHVLPSLMHGLWVVQNNLPARLIDPVIYQWGLRVNRDFHLVKVEDRRHAERLPGTKDVADMAHNGGWYIDYSTSLVVSPEGEVYILISKNDLGDKLPPGMAEGVGLLAQFLPENTDQAVNEGTIVDTSIHGLHSDFIRRGGQNVVVYGALTMGAVTQPQVVAVSDPRFLLDPQYTTGLELAGVGRPSEITRERIAVQGTIARTRGVRSMSHRGHNAGPKPDQPFGATPTEAHVVVEEEPILARPRGTKLLDAGEILPDWNRRYAAEVAHIMGKRGASLEFSARELRKTPTHRTAADHGARRHQQLASHASARSVLPLVGVALGVEMASTGVMEVVLGG